MAGRTVAQKLIAEHLVEGEPTPGTPIALAIDQTLTQDATGTLVMLALEAMDLDYAAVELGVQYVDHNLLQMDYRNADDHRFLESACRRFGIWYSRPGNGVSHPVHMQRFGKPGKSLLGSDSHTCAAGSLGMLAIGAGGLDVALAISGQPYETRMPKIFGVRLVGELPDFVSAKDIILEMLRRHGVSGGAGCIIEYHGPGLGQLSAMDRHVIANMGAELGATTTVFPADAEVERFLESEERGADFTPIEADADARYDREDEIDLSELEPLIAKPSSPGNVVPVADIAGEPAAQCYIGSSANPGWRDFAVAAEMLKGRTTPSTVSLDINPTSRQLLQMLIRDGHLGALLAAGARLHQAGCNGCIGMGQAPAVGQNSLRTVPRNFPGRSGTEEDSVFLCSPETAAASALTGEITDPRTLGIAAPELTVPERTEVYTGLLSEPAPAEQAREVELVKGPNISTLPDFDALPDRLALPVILKMGDDVSTDEIMPAGTDVLPYRSNVEKIAEFSFSRVDRGFCDKLAAGKGEDGFMVAGGANYGQGSSREHAALGPRFLDMRAVVAESISRIHRKNLINWGILPVFFADEDGYDRIEPGDVLVFEGLRRLLESGEERFTAELEGKGTLDLSHDLSRRDREILLAGGLINWRKERMSAQA